jgi:hypothetical protein
MNLMASIARFVVRRFRPSGSSVLRSLNDARRALGIPELDCLPVGHTHRMGGCPISRALPGVVGVDGVAFAIPDQAIAVASVWHTSVLFSRTGVYIARLPRTLVQFVQDFDLGAFPELEADAFDQNESVEPLVQPARRKAA